MKFEMEQFVKATGAKVLREGTRKACLGISTDSRTIREGELFFALRGPNFDGHSFIETAIEKGAWGAIVEKVRSPQSIVHSPSSLLQVPDTLKALGDIARWWRAQFDIPCVAVTGSNGKTTTKEMIASMLSKKWSVLKTEGNFNNLIGLPLTLDRLDQKIQTAVLEMGMNAPGEIRRLTEIADPTVGLVTNATAAHLEKLHTVEAVAKAKNELYETMSAKGTAVYNDEDFWMRKLAQNFKGRKISFGMKPDLDVSFEHMENIGFDSMELKINVQGKLLKAKLKTTGIHNVMNAMAAAAAALSFELPLEMMKRGLEDFVPLKMRFEQVQLKNGVRLINDAYNANPVSMEKALQTVCRQKKSGRFIAVLGDMKELGEESSKLHQELGRQAVQNGVQSLFLAGEFAEEIAKGALAEGMDKRVIKREDDLEKLAEAVAKTIQSGDVVLIKASRAMQLEKIAEELKERFGI